MSVFGFVCDLTSLKAEAKKDVRLNTIICIAQPIRRPLLHAYSRICKVPTTALNVAGTFFRLAQCSPVTKSWTSFGYSRI